MSIKHDYGTDFFRVKEARRVHKITSEAKGFNNKDEV